ncbi:hypothetical protein ACODNH_18700 [Haloarcula sp. NS06]|nr:hypothetical protein [Haloarcula sp. H-GB4]MDQ2072323.1 hypothetical protein [Haloarcula sp. H-GB4]
MGDYAKPSRAAKIKCIKCNSPVVVTVDEEYVCVNCGEAPIESTAPV